jgi:SAM-dependent methyltransferase
MNDSGGDVITQMVDWMGRNHWRFSPMNLYEKFEKHRFDRRYGVDTQLDVNLSDVSIDSPNKHRGARYHATPPVAFKRALKRLKVNLADYTFVDFGSGKGRTLLLASDFPFKRIIGVEFGKELHQHALSNIARYKAKHHSQIESIHADATQFVLPDGPLVLYFFNPFDGIVLEQVLANIRHAATRSKRRIFILYLYLENEDVFRKSGQFVPVFHWHRFDAFECKPS